MIYMLDTFGERAEISFSAGVSGWEDSDKVVSV